MESNWSNAVKQIRGEYHVTVLGDPLRWVEVCKDLGIKSLWIELNTFERQLMCAAKADPRGPHALAADIAANAFNVIRIKSEVQPRGDAPQQALYWECHVKCDGPFRPGIAWSSRDLYRENRWYITRRQAESFDPRPWVEQVRGWVSLPDAWRQPSTVAGWEYEACVLDSNPELDAHWSLTHAL